MSKRGAERQLTKDDPDSGDDERQSDMGDEQGGTWKPASNEQIAGRTIIKARRKGISAPTGVAMPAFNFGASMPAAPASTPAESPASTPPAAAAPAPAAAAPAAAAPLNALQALAAKQAASGWSCPTCDTHNKLSAAACAACEEPNPNMKAPAPAAAAPANFMQQLAARQAAENWECPACTTSNKMAVSKCASCEEPRPGQKAGESAPAAASAAAPVSFSFGAAPGGVSFGAPAAAASSSTTAPPASGFGVTFGGAAPSSSAVTFGSAATSASSSAAPSGVFSFGSGDSAASLSQVATPSFSFGGVASGAPLASFGSVASSAGSVSLFGSSSASASPPQFEASSAEALQSANSELSSEFRGASKESTGEENDEVHLRIQTKVFQVKRVPVVKVAPEQQHGPTSEVTAAAAGVSKETAPAPAAGVAAAPSADSGATELKQVEIGSGELHVNTVLDPATGKTRARLVLREDRTKRSVLNAPLFADMVYSLQSDKLVRFNSLDLEGQMAVFTLKFKQKGEAQETVQAMDKCLALIKA